MSQKTFRVVWEIEVDAIDAVEAAKEARKIQLDPDNIATHFEVFDTTDNTLTALDLDLKFCEISHGSSRMCEMGTKSCNVRHPRK